MIRITVDRETCRTYGNCVLIAEDLFELDDEGRVVLKRVVVEDGRLEDVRRAEYDCPTDSIAWEEVSSES